MTTNGRGRSTRALEWSIISVTMVHLIGSGPSNQPDISGNALLELKPLISFLICIAGITCGRLGHSQMSGVRQIEQIGIWQWQSLGVGDARYREYSERRYDSPELLQSG
jgi:hypothetical protein